MPKILDHLSEFDTAQGQEGDNLFLDREVVGINFDVLLFNFFDFFFKGVDDSAPVGAFVKQSFSYDTFFIMIIIYIIIFFT